ncbi:KDO transferase A isoform X2 [Tasmannia lanceolata]|uniref:KDO transferase A isoform X2 n=1 Tax=Tasmannia lanceolata TaxID=3420 RepID=UPI00406400BF
MKMGGEKGKVVYRIYRAVTTALSPFLFLHLQWRRFQGLEHPLRWKERLGRPSSPRPDGLLLWFHAVSLGEGMAVIPVIKRCAQQNPNFTILMTSTTTSAFEVIKDRLPNNVIYQFAPIDTPAAVDAFLGFWHPTAIFLMESELWPNLILSASGNGIAVALLNARVSAKSFRLWSGPVALPLVSLMLSKFSLISPLSTVEAIRFQLLQAPPFIINFAGDLKYAVGNVDVPEKENTNMEDLQMQLTHRPFWMASSLHKGEEEGELRGLYRLTAITVIGGSFLPGLAGHNISEAAAAGCAVLTGPHVGHFSHMVLEMQQSNALSILQVSGKLELAEALNELLGNPEVLEARRRAAKQAFLALSSGVVENVWNLVNTHVLKQAFSNLDEG